MVRRGRPECGCSIAAESKWAGAAWEWMKYIAMGEGNRLFVKAQGRANPAIKIDEEA